jgi:integrase
MTETALAVLRRSRFHVIEWQGRPVRSIKKSFQEAVRRAGLGAGVAPYTLRRTMASELRNRGVPIDEIAGIMGHRSRDHAITEVCAQYRPKHTDAAPRAIDEYFAKLRPRLSRPLRASCRRQGRASC